MKTNPPPPSDAPRSMTGYGAGVAEGPQGRFRAELRGVNGRFLEVRPRLPAMMIPFEAELRRRIGEALSRGRVDLSLFYEAPDGTSSPFGINVDAARAYRQAADRLSAELGLSGSISIPEMLGLPGVVEADRADPATPELRDLALTAVDAALRELVAMRVAEGAATAADIRARLEALVALRARIALRADAFPAAAKKKLEERLARLGADTAADPARLAQEVAYIADRSDIAEELARLEAHLGRCFEALSKKSREPIGKSLEFLAQELHRETNTIGSKTQDTEVTGFILEMKSEIERIREQVQNLE